MKAMGENIREIFFCERFSAQMSKGVHSGLLKKLYVFSTLVPWWTHTFHVEAMGYFMPDNNANP